MRVVKAPLFAAFALHALPFVTPYSIDPKSCADHMETIKDGVEAAMSRAQLTAKELSKGSNEEVTDVAGYMVSKNQLGTVASFMGRILKQQGLADREHDDPKQPTIFCDQSRLELIDLEDGEEKYIYHTDKNEAWPLGDDYEACEKGEAAGYTLIPDRGHDRKPEIQICPPILNAMRGSPVTKIDDIPDDGEWRDVEKKNRDNTPGADSAIDRFRLLDHLMLHEFAHTPNALNGSPIKEVYFWKPCTQIPKGLGIKNADSLAYVGLAIDLLARPGLKVTKEGELDF